MPFTVPAPDPRTQPPKLPGFEHGVHVDCQQSAPFLMAICGRVMDWSETPDAAGEPLRVCPKCAQVKRCPVCRLRIKRS